jgi:hypothetical protein
MAGVGDYHWWYVYHSLRNHDLAYVASITSVSYFVWE